MRTLPQCRELEKRIGPEDLFLETGKKAMFIDSIYRMMWMRENCPEILDKAYKWLLIEDYVNYKLCGEMATDYSMGSTTSALRPDTHTWSDKILCAAGIEKELFPEPHLSGKVLGEVLPSVRELTGLKKGVKVVLGGHDYICAAFAAGVVDESRIMDITGTWEMLIRGCRNLDLSPGSGRSGYYIEGHVVADSWCICESNVSGDMAEWFRHSIAPEEEERARKEGKSVWELLMQDAGKSPAGSKGCVFLPHFSGSNAPVTEPTSLGAFAGLHNKITRPDMLHAVLEGLTYKMREMMEDMTGQDPLPQMIIAAGGATRNPLWMQMKSDVMGIPIEAPGLHEATPLGAAMLAGLGTGVYQNAGEAVAAVYKKGAFYEPDRAKHDYYTDLYLNVYRLLQPALAQVNANVHSRFIGQG
jgi:xylulokinase